MLAVSPHIVEMRVSGQSQQENPLNQNAQLAIEIKERATIGYSCLREFIVANHSIYVFCSITGILTPDAHDNQKNSLTSHNYRYRFWYIYLHLAFLTAFLYFMIEGVITMVTYTSYDLLLFCEYFGVALQLILLVPIVIYLRAEIVARREIDDVLYIEAFGHAIKLAKRVFVVISILSLLFYGMGTFSSGEEIGLCVVYFLLYVIILTPVSFFLSGIVAFLIVEQRISFRTMERVHARVKEELLTHEEYFEARESIDSRDKLTPLNIVTFTALLNCVFCIILMFAIKKEDSAKVEVIFAVVYVLSNFGKQPVVIAAVLWEIVKVNEIAERIVEYISRQRWYATEGAEGNRVSLYIAAKEYPIGSTILFMRPTKFQVRLQLASVVIGVGTAVFWALIFA